MTSQTVRAGWYPARTAPRSHHTALEGTMTTPTPPDATCGACGGRRGEHWHRCPDKPQPTGAEPTPPDAARTPCSDVPCDTGPGEPCEKHEREWSHAEDDHELCGPECDAWLRQRIETALREADNHSCMYQEGTDYAELAAAVLPRLAEVRVSVLRIVSDWCIEANEVGGVDADDLAWRLEQAGLPMPDEDETASGAIHQDGAGS